MSSGVLTSCYGQLEMVGKILKMLEVICLKSTGRQDNEELSGQAGGGGGVGRGELSMI